MRTTHAIKRSEKPRYIKDFPNKSYLAAPFRYSLSATAETMINQGFLDGSESHLDYGCGRGGDVERLRSLGYKSTGYDPYYFPGDIEPSDVVTMSYVLNVVEDPQERREALTRAWSLTRKCLIVAANVRGRGNGCESISKIGTFRKFYSFVELKAYIESVLGFEAVRLDRDKFIIHRDGRQFTPLHYEEVMELERTIALSGWVAPPDAIIKRYRSGSSKAGPDAHLHYRLVSNEKCLPGKKGELVRVIHLRGGLDSEHGRWAVSGLQRRDRILQAKFHCIEQSFLNQFAGCRNFDFLFI